MAVFRGFRAYRPSAERQADIPALPYDVMSSDEAREMVKGKPFSFLHIDKAEIDLPMEINQYDERVYLKAKENLLKLYAKPNGEIDGRAAVCDYFQAQREMLQKGNFDIWG
ncbi:MAG: DUF1015 family protein, partial [Eubacterium sp.]|nr:DUF1015 family protein [Eubacterium sp.]